MKSILKLQQDCIKIDIYVYAGIESNQLHICIYEGTNPNKTQRSQFMLPFNIVQALDFIHRQQKPFTVMFEMSWEKIMCLKYHYDYLHWWDFQVNRKCATSNTWEYFQKEKCSSSKDVIITFVRIFMAIRFLLLSQVKVLPAHVLVN